LRHLGNLIRSKNPDFITLQEIKPKFMNYLNNRKWLRGYYISSNEKDFDPYGNIIISRYKFYEFASLPFQNTKMKRKMMLSTFICEGGPQLTLGTFHLESFPEDVDKRKEQLQTFHENTEHSKYVILCGDTNFVNDDEDNILKPKFKDAWRELHQKTDQEAQENPGYTFDSETNIMAKLEQKTRRARIDRCYYSHENITPVQMEIIGTKPYRDEEYISDHYGIYIKLRINY